MNDTFHRDVLKEMIRKNGSRLFSVEFTKKDGSLRQMTCHAAVIRDIKGIEASEQAQRAVATRKANNPNLANVIDVAKQARRSINLDTVTSITMNKKKYSLSQKVG